MFKIAHRGASGHELENSMSSLNKAIELGVDIVEADVQVTKDDVPIIFHDRLLDRLTNTSGYTYDFTWKEYQKDIRLKNGESVLRLEEYCEVIKATEQKLYLDIKTLGNEAEILEACLQILPKDKFLMGSFHNHSIRLIKYMDSEVATVMIMEGNPINIEKVIYNASCDIVALGFDSIEEDHIKVAQELGKKVFVWVVNDEREIQRAKNLGVDGITSDFPDRI